MSTLSNNVVPKNVSSARVRKYADLFAGEITDEMAEIAVAELKKRFFTDGGMTDHCICEECLANCLRESSKLPRMAKAIALSALTHKNVHFETDWAKNVRDAFLESKNPNNDEIKAVAAKLN